MNRFQRGGGDLSVICNFEENLTSKSKMIRLSEIISTLLISKGDITLLNFIVINGKRHARVYFMKKTFVPSAFDIRLTQKYHLSILITFVD